MSFCVEQSFFFDCLPSRCINDLLWEVHLRALFHVVQQHSKRTILQIDSRNSADIAAVIIPRLSQRGISTHYGSCFNTRDFTTALISMPVPAATTQCLGTMGSSTRITP
jgi:hypothetical protein